MSKTGLTIQTKAKVGDTIYYLFDSFCCSSKVQHIQINTTGSDNYHNGIKIEYKTSQGNIEDKNVFLSREELGNAIIRGAL